MKLTTHFFMFLIAIMMVSCTPKKTNNPEGWSEKQLSEWFIKGDWKSGWKAAPDESVNQREFAAQFFKNKERWEKAFKYLNSNDLNTLPPGRYDIEGDTLYVSISEYMTKNEEEGKFEAHRKYADIQYLVSGEEQIGIIPLKETTETVPYDSSKDIIFLNAPQNNYHLASPDRFFVFFPGDAHKPGIKISDNIKVRKVVVKVLL